MTHQTAALQGDRTANEVLSHAKLVRWVWAACNELATAVVDCWPAELPLAQCPGRHRGRRSLRSLRSMMHVSIEI